MVSINVTENMDYFYKEIEFYFVIMSQCVFCEVETGVSNVWLK